MKLKIIIYHKHLITLKTFLTKWQLFFEKQLFFKKNFLGLLSSTTIASLIISNLALAQPKGDKAFGEYLAQECVTCHRADGQMKGIPPIVGYPADVFIQFMNEYKTKKRSNSQMQAIAAKFSDQEIASLAAFYEEQKPK